MGQEHEVNRKRQYNQNGQICLVGTYVLIDVYARGYQLGGLLRLRKAASYRTATKVAADPKLPGSLGDVEHYGNKRKYTVT